MLQAGEGALQEEQQPPPSAPAAASCFFSTVAATRSLSPVSELHSTLRSNDSMMRMSAGML